MVCAPEDVGARADRVKLLAWDGNGLVMIYKRLDEGKFRWPRIEVGVMRLSPPLILTLERPKGRFYASATLRPNLSNEEETTTRSDKNIVGKIGSRPMCAIFIWQL